MTDPSITAITKNTAIPAKSPAQVWQEMLHGNERFIAGVPSHPRQDVERRTEVAKGQTPGAALFGCSDSRLAAEIIFDKGIGDLFVVRNAGQIFSDSVVGSLEYAVDVLKVSLIVVLGHDECGAVLAAIASRGPDAPPLPPHIANLVAKIFPAVDRVSGRSTAARGQSTDARGQSTDARGHDTDSAFVGEVDSPEIDALEIDALEIDALEIDALEVGREHLRDTIGELIEASELISEAIAAGTLAVVGANYRLLEGRVIPDITIGNL